MMENRQKQRKNSSQIGGERRAGDTARIAESLAVRGRVSLCVHGTSMMPWVRPGDIAMIRTEGAETLRCGHVVLFRRNSSLFVHRIVNKKGPQDAAQILVKGDAHPTSDGLMEQGELLGRVVWLYREGRRIDLDARGQRALGLFISRLSLYGWSWHPAVRFAANVMRPARRAIQALRFASEAIR
jgi:signal peptidase I